MSWIKLKDGHRWLSNELIAWAGKIENDNITWHMHNGTTWNGKGSTKEYLVFGYDECTEEEAMEMLKKDPVKG